MYEVYLPTTLKKFDTDAFEGCKALSFIYLKNSPHQPSEGSDFCLKVLKNPLSILAH